MREIKFRAWNPLAGEMFYGTSAFIYHGDGGLEAKVMYKGQDVDQILMQSTGLHDRNGKEIYEGDVLSFQRNSHGEVYWGDAGWWVKNTWRDEALDYVRDLTQGKFEVVGNVWENPDLVKKGDKE